MAHQAKVLTALGAGIAVMAVAAFSGSPASAKDRTTNVTQTKPIVLAEAKKSKKKNSTKSSTKSGKKTTRTKPPAQPRRTRGSYSGG